MNRNGIMVDFEATAERRVFMMRWRLVRCQSYVGHSNSKVLCDVPRNLTDDQHASIGKEGWCGTYHNVPRLLEEG